jgi:hypothetical protein
VEEARLAGARSLGERLDLAAARAMIVPPIASGSAEAVIDLSSQRAPRNSPRTLRACVALLGLMALGCISHANDAREAALPDALAGSVIEYRFAIGRLYRATYSADTVDFVLLEPAQADPPSATLPYTSRTIRPGLFFVSWGGEPSFRSSFVIDLERQQLHASSTREGDRLFFETAVIERHSRVD